MTWASTRGLLRADLLRSRRDPVMLTIGLLPPLLVVLYAVFSDQLLAAAGDYAAAAHIGSAATLLLITPMMFGFVAGLMILDERDEGVLAAIEVSPVGRTGHLTYRLVVPMVLSAAMALLIAVTIGRDRAGAAGAVLLAVTAALQAPMMALLLGAFARNKVEGLAISKAGNVVVLLGALAVLLPLPWRFAAWLMPHFWSVELLVRPLNGVARSGAGAAALASHLIVVAALLHAFRRRIE